MEYKMRTILDQSVIAEKTLDKTNGAFGKKIGLINKILGCWHPYLSRPFSNRGGSYRSCLHCGARKKFNTETLETKGPFYYPPTIDQTKAMI